MWGKGVPSEVTAHTVAAVEECSGKELHDGSECRETSSLHPSCSLSQQEPLMFHTADHSKSVGLLRWAVFAETFARTRRII